MNDHLKNKNPFVIDHEKIVFSIPGRCKCQGSNYKQAQRSKKLFCLTCFKLYEHKSQFNF